MTKKSIILIIGIICLIALLSVFFYLKKGGEQAQEPSPITDTEEVFPISESGRTLAPDEIPVLLKSGGSLPVHDIRSDEGTTKDEGSFHRLYDFGPKDSVEPRFILLYSEMDQGFLMTLLATPLTEVRREAEQEFLKRLQISEREACFLSVSVGVPVSISDTFSGRDLGLSFCPNSIPLE